MPVARSPRSRAWRAGPAYPEGVQLEAGPWFSNEEAKMVLVLDIADHAKTFGVFGAAMANGRVLRRP
jgi:hypothetical protein